MVYILYSSDSSDDLSPEGFENLNYIDLEGTGLLLNELTKVVSKSAAILFTGELCVCVIFVSIVGNVQSPRSFPKCLEKGTPNFLSVPPCKMILRNCDIED